MKKRQPPFDDGGCLFVFRLVVQVFNEMAVGRVSNPDPDKLSLGVASVFTELLQSENNDKKGFRHKPKPFFNPGWGTGIRTPISGVRVRCLAIRPSPSGISNQE
jgi:hypothetical protein